MTWKSPNWLWLLLAIPAILVLLTQWGRDRRRARATYADPNVLDISFPKRVSRLRLLALIAGVLAATSGILAMARPAVAHEGKEERSTVMLAIDTSKSMLSTDLAPSRLEAGTAAAKEFIEAAPKDTAIGFVTFDNGARVRVSPTTNHDEVIAALDDLKINQGTAIGDAIESSLQAIQASGALATEPAAGTPSAARILLMTDGENTTGTDPLDAARRAQQLRVPVYTVLLGTDPATPKAGQLSPLEVLTAVANQTGGVFTQSTTSSDLSQIYKDIGSSLASIERLDELTVWAVLAAVLFMLAGMGALAMAELRPYGPAGTEIQGWS
jgi:Ca-activated chloride channel family protein